MAAKTPTFEEKATGWQDASTVAARAGVPVTGLDYRTATGVAGVARAGLPIGPGTNVWSFDPRTGTVQAGGTGSSSPVVPGIPAGLTGPQQNAYEAVEGILQQYGLQSLAPVLLGYVQQNFDPSTINYLIQQTPQWQQRFYGNVLLAKAGLAQLDPATYLSTEASYASALTQNGIPQGMFGQSDFAQWIGNSVSPSEINSRAQLAAQAINDTDPYFMEALTQFHGVTQGQLTGYYLDQQNKLPYLNLVSQQAQIGAAALRQGLKASPEFSMQLANLGVTQQQAEQGYSQIAQTLPRLEQLGKLSGINWTQQQSEQAQFLGEGAVQREQLSLAQQEQARFAGTAGMGTNFYHPAYGLARDLEGAF